MIEDPSTETPSSTTAQTPNQPSRDTIHALCRFVSALAWIAIVFWILAPRGSHWANAACDAGLAWILLTGGGYFAEPTVRSFVNLWKEFLASFGRDMTCKNKEHSPR
jgi:hypothetical protein